MSVTQPPVSSQRRLEVQKKLEKSVEDQENALRLRMASNASYAETAVEKILKEFSREQKNIQEKLDNPDILYKKAETKFFVVIQIRSIVNSPPAAKKTLELLRLGRINSCVIVRNNLSMKKMLVNAQNYIAYGYLDYRLLRKLLYLRGKTIVDGLRLPLSNEMIESHFEGKYKCIEELAYAIYTGVDDIKSVLNFIAPIRLSPPVGGFGGHKKRGFVQGGSSNDHKDLLGKLLEKMI